MSPAALPHRARKRFGQHFLRDESCIAAIVAAVAARPEDALVEIGPGLGALTRPLMQAAGRLCVIELDRDLAARLRTQPQIDLLQADALKVDFCALSARLGAALRLVGNLPYNISTPLLFHLLEQVRCIRDQHFMLQKEVVQRLCAAPATAAYGRLSVMLQWRYAIEHLLDVAPQAFEPAPKVDSAVVRMTPLQHPAEADPAVLGAVVRSAFSQRRKLLRHTLGRWLESRAYTGQFELQRRAEEVPVAQYVALAMELAPLH